MYGGGAVYTNEQQVDESKLLCKAPDKRKTCTRLDIGRFAQDHSDTDTIEQFQSICNGKLLPETVQQLRRRYALKAQKHQKI